MVGIDRARLSDRREIEKLIAAYHTSEGLIPRKERIAWGVTQQLRGLFPGVLLLARDRNIPVAVCMAVFTPSAELGLVMTVNDFFVTPAFRRKGVGRKIVKRLIEECRLMRINEINLEVISGNKTAAAFWRSVGFELANRVLFELKLAPTGGVKNDAS